MAKKEYLDFTKYVMKSLTNFSLFLKLQEKPERKNLLKIHLKKLNNLIKARRRTQ